MKFHVNPSTGKAAKCTAKPGNCRFGAQALHFTTEFAAMKAFEMSMEGETFASLSKQKEAEKFAAKAAKNPNLDTIAFKSYEEAQRRLTEIEQNELFNQDTIVRDWYWDAREQGLNHSAAYGFALDWDEASHEELAYDEVRPAYDKLLHAYTSGTRKPGEPL